MGEEDYRNAFASFIGVGNMIGVNKLYDEFGGRVFGASGRALVQFCRGYLAYVRKDYEEADSAFMHAATVIPQGINDRLEAEIFSMHIRTFWDHNDWIGVRQMIRKMEHLLGSRSKNENLPMAKFINFFNCVRDLHQVLTIPRKSLAQKQKKIDDLNMLIAQYEIIFAGKWINEKIDALQKSKE